MLGIYGQREPYLNCDPSAAAPPGTDTVRAAARSVRGGVCGCAWGEATGNRLRAMGTFATGKAARGAAPDRGRKDGRSGAALSADLRSPGSCPARALNLGRRPFVSVLLMCPRGSGTREARCVHVGPGQGKPDVSTWVRDKGSPMCKLVSSVSGQASLPSVQRASIFFWTRWSQPGAGSTPGKGITELKDGSHGLNGLQARKCV